MPIRYERHITRDMLRAEPETYGIVFITICAENGMGYVAKTTRLQMFEKGRYIGSGGRHYKRAKQKYGYGSFTAYVLERVPDGHEALNAAESRWIAHYRGVWGADRLYNETDGGDGLSPSYAKLRAATDTAFQKAHAAGVLRCWIGDEKRRAKMSALAAEKNTREYRVLSPDGYVHIFRDLSAFCRERGLGYSSMRMVCQGRIFKKYGSYLGWVSLDHYPHMEPANAYSL